MLCVIYILAADMTLTSVVDFLFWLTLSLFRVNAVGLSTSFFLVAFVKKVMAFPVRILFSRK